MSEEWWTIASPNIFDEDYKFEAISKQCVLRHFGDHRYKFLLILHQIYLRFVIYMFLTFGLTILISN